MNCLPNEIQIQILKNLSGRDIARFERVSTFYRDLISCNRKILPKEKVSLTIGNGQKRSTFLVKVREVDCLCYFGMGGKLILLNQHPRIAAFKKSFMFYASEHKGTPHHKLFFKFLLINFELECLNIEPFEGLEDLCPLLEDAMESVQFHCPVVVMNWGLHKDLNHGCPEVIPEFLQKFVILQQKTKVNPQLRISDQRKTSGSMPRLWFCFACIAIYSKIFSDVVCDYNYISMPVNLAGIVQMWYNNGYNRNGVAFPLETITFQMRYRYEKPVSDAHKNQVAKFVGQFLSRGNIQLNNVPGSIYLINMSDETFVELADFEKFHELPEEILFGRDTDNKKLKFKLKKEEGSVFVTTELL